MDKRSTLLKAALNLFVEFGFHGTSTSNIAKRAGVATGTLFIYFKTKEELIVALYSDIKNQLSVYVGNNTKTGNSLKETLKSQYSVTLRWALDNKKEFQFIEQFNNSPFISMVSKEDTYKHIRPHLDLLSKGVKDKVLKPMPVEFLFLMITGVTNGLNKYLVSNKFPKNKEQEFINNTFELIWNMIT